MGPASHPQDPIQTGLSQKFHGSTPNHLSTDRFTPAMLPGNCPQPRVTVKSCPPLLGHATRGGHVLLAREGELGWGGQGASAKMQIQFCILLGSSGGASQGAANASLVLKTTARDPVKRLSVWGQSSSGPTSLARSRPSITSWCSTEWLIVSALLGEQMARPCALHPPPPVCLNPSSSVREVQVTPTWF